MDPASECAKKSFKEEVEGEEEGERLEMSQAKSKAMECTKWQTLKKDERKIASLPGHVCKIPCMFVRDGQELKGIYV